jgi:hypothetical protein
MGLFGVKGPKSYTDTGLDSENCNTIPFIQKLRNSKIPNSETPNFVDL